jgi:hypothetical protein
MCDLQVEFPFLSENERFSCGTLCRLSETRPCLSETSNRLSENSPLLSELVINKRTRTVKTRGSLNTFQPAPLQIHQLSTHSLRRVNKSFSSSVDNSVIQFSLCITFSDSSFLLSSIMSIFSSSVPRVIIL